MFTQTQIETIVEIMSNLSTKDTKVYLGCDSIVQKVKGKFVGRYATVLIIHNSGMEAEHIGKIFSHISYVPNYDLKKNRPQMRMMNEVQKVCELYVQIAPFIDEFDIEIHLDINLDPKHGSNCAATQAAGYVLGMTGIEPKLKPNSWAASFGADRAVHKQLAYTSYAE